MTIDSSLKNIKLDTAPINHSKSAPSYYPADPQIQKLALEYLNISSERSPKKSENIFNSMLFLESEPVLRKYSAVAPSSNKTKVCEPKYKWTRLYIPKYIRQNLALVSSDFATVSPARPRYAKQKIMGNKHTFSRTKTTPVSKSQKLSKFQKPQNP